jgi:hypothetical protein
MKNNYRNRIVDLLGKGLASIAFSGGITVALAAVTGEVFQDFNGNGVKDTTTTTANNAGGGVIGAAIDVGTAGVGVTLTCVTSRGADGILGTADDTTASVNQLTTATGGYSLTVAATVAPTAAETTAGKTACRVAFDWSAGGPAASNPLFGFQPVQVGSGSNTTVQFVNDGGIANLAINYPADFCQNNPLMVLPCNRFGTQIGNTNEALYSFPYSAKGGNGGATPAPVGLAKANEIGPTYGVAFHRAAKVIFAGAHYKRHVGTGPNGLGAIYRITPGADGLPGTDDDVPSLFLDLENLFPGSAGVDTRTGAYDYSRDALLRDGSVGKKGIGDLDISDNGRTLYAIGMASRKLYVLPVGDTATAPVASAATEVTLPSPPSCPVGDGTGTGYNNNLRPMALKTYRGSVYVGITCTGEFATGGVANTATALRAYVYRYDGTAFTLVADEALNYTADRSTLPWNTWRDATRSTNGGCCQEIPQPLLADIEFNRLGHMVLGIRDRFGDVTSIAGIEPFLSPTVGEGVVDGRAHGDILRLCRDTSAAGELYSTTVAACPANYSDSFNNAAASGFGSTDGNASNGALMAIPGFPQIAVVVKDPVVIYSAGIAWFNNSGTTYNKGYEIAGAATGLGKANALGDLEALCDSAPIEIGNRVWLDTNKNGIQDPGEPPIAGATVRLYDASNNVIGTAVTNAAGEYIFSNRAQSETGTALTSTGSMIYGISALTQNTNGFQIRLDNPTDYAASGALASLNLTTPNAGGNASNDPISDVADSDATLANPTQAIGAGNYPTISFNTGDAGSNNHGLDFGFQPTFAIGNRVWLDSNNNSMVDAGEAGIDGVVVQLWAADASGNPTGTVPLATDTTQSGGYYLFNKLPAGNYVVVIPASNFAASAPLAGTFSSGTTLAAGVATSESAASTDVTSTGTNKDHGTKLTASSGSVPIGAVKSTLYVLGAGQATGEDANTTAGRVDVTPDASSNLTADFGFFKPFDLKITKAVTSSGPYTQGVSTVSFTLSAENLGPGVASGAVFVKDKLPAGLTATGATGAGWTCTPLTGAAVEITCTRTAPVSIAAGTALPLITITATIDLTAPTGALTNVARVEPDPADATNNRPELIPLGTSNGGYEDGSNTGTGTGANPSNNDDSKAITVGPATYAVGNRIWFDTNNNGMLDAGEAPVDGVTVELLNSAGNVVGTTTTAAGGYYLFDNLAAGTYSVRVAASNWNPTSGVLRGYASSNGATATSTNIADNNKDHGVDPVTPNLYAANGVSSGPIVLGGAGNQTMSGEDGGTGVPTSSAGDTLDNKTIDFGFYRLTVGNQVWLDSGTGGGVVNDGIKQANEVGINGVVVELKDSGGNLVATTTTAGGGLYSFTQRTDGGPILPGTYTVNIPGAQSALSGLLSSADPAGGGQPSGDSRDNGVGINAATGATTSASVTLTPGSSAAGSLPTNSNGTTDQPRMDFGFVGPTFALGNRVWNDINNNGVLDSGELGLDGVMLSLLDSATGNVIATTTTANGGYYLFSGLPAGSYVVEVMPPVGYVTSTGANGSATGPYEAGSADFTATGDSKDHGTRQASGKIRSAAVTLGTGLQPSGEVKDPAGTDSTPDDRTNLTVDFGLFAPASLGTVVWIDNGVGGGIANDGKKQASEPGIPGVIVRLLDGAGAPIVNPATGTPVTTTTDANGNYGFGNLVAGNYQVEFVFPANSSITTTINPAGSGNPATNPSVGGADSQSNEMNPTTRRSPVIALAAGADNPNLDAGVRSYVEAATSVPTLSEWMLMLLAVLMLVFATPAIQRRR